MSIRAYAVNGVTLYQVDVTVRSKKDQSIRVQRRRSGIPTMKEAQQEERTLLEAALEEMVAKELSELAWGKLVGEWEMALRDGKSGLRAVGRTTIEDYIQALRTYSPDWWKTPANEVSAVDIKGRYQEMRDQGLSQSACAKLRSAINGMFAWAIETRRLKGVVRSPAFGVSIKLSGREEQKRPEILNEGQIRELLRHAKESGSRWYPVWSFAVLSGMRSGELFALPWSEVDEALGVIHVKYSYNKRYGNIGSTKNRDWRDVPINPDLAQLLMELKPVTRETGYVLPRIGEWNKGMQASALREFCQSCGLPSIRFHTLRACFATHLLAKGVSIPRVMQVGGWKSLKVMQRYIRLAGLEIQGVTDSLQFLPPPSVTGVVVDLFKK